MNKRELEQYIISKPNVIKCSIPGWKYIRYTVYDLTFASLEVRDIGVVLTVWGRYDYYEKEYPDLVVPAVNNEPLHFTSILLSKGEVPDHVIKSLIDSSYNSRLSTVVMPCISGVGREDIPYKSIGKDRSEQPANSEFESSTAETEDRNIPTDIKTTADFEAFQRIRREIASLSSDEELIGLGNCINLPYVFGEDDEILAEYAALKERLRALNKKKSKKNDKK